MKVIKALSTILILIIVFSLIPAMPSPPTQASTTINIGDYVQMGRYYDEPILWRCVDIDENGPLMLSDKILTIKPFDVAGNHTYLDGTTQADTDGLRTLYGSNLWETSNLRSWLNSTASAGNVTWLDGCPPTADKVFGGCNSYATEKGFLAEGNFTSSEQYVIKSVTQKSLINSIDVPKLKVNGTDLHKDNEYISTVVQNYDTAYYQNVTDKIFLLDVKQINKVYLNSATLGENYYIGKPTTKAVDNSEFKNSSLSTEYCWYNWIRSPHSGFSIPFHVRDVSSNGFIFTLPASICFEGVRPAFFINLSSAVFECGNGSVETPFVLSIRINSPEPTPEPTPESIPTTDPTATPTPIPTPLMGDATGDGKITSADALKILQSIIGKVVLTDIQKVAADVTKNGLIQPSDALKILQYCSGIISGFN